jgi:cytochrome c-type biogenesis protein CcmH
VTVWIAIALVAAAALAMLLPPLLRRGPQDGPRAAYDARIYRDQLAEVERDAARGVITGAEAEAARTEIARRLLAADDEAKAEAPQESRRTRSPIAALAVGLGVPALALAIYLAGGAPGLPGRAPDAVTAGGAGNMEALVAELGEKLKSRPDDARGWALYARSLASLGRMAEAVPAFTRAASLDPENADVQSQLGEALSFAAGGTVTPRAAEAFGRALAIDAQEPRARYYLGLADRQAGRPRAALDRWLALETDAPADAPWRGVLTDRIAEVAAELQLDDAALAALRRKAAEGAAPQAAKAPPGPGAADLEAAQSMSPEERSEMIRGMVGRLAERMKESPDDVAGWERLARSYRVLGEAGKARAALGEIARLRPEDVAAQTEYASALAQTLQPGDAVPAELAALSDRILILAPDHPGALFYAGLARAQAGDDAGARARWERLLRIVPADSPGARDLKRRLDALESPAR